MASLKTGECGMFEAVRAGTSLVSWSPAATLAFRRRARCQPRIPPWCPGRTLREQTVQCLHEQAAELKSRNLLSGLQCAECIRNCRLLRLWPPEFQIQPQMSQQPYLGGLSPILSRSSWLAAIMAPLGIVNHLKERNPRDHVIASRPCLEPCNRIP
ncbi:uncharacterized protein LY79DRAFT_539614 [Colletotrichum navitas]|uniref:Uncharacterized protein n=1 Tax=Colletotrichum navitas TaxID=681940 RepID=A0AAD8VB10_9PEZI|nr:uncharacterized protein LY79DRAFT_539614 [Colletotrichum navitas]KAK1597950.1 hypothetical protein LY79DRAFT_539614 [Colletotrichum navitas]